MPNPVLNLLSDYQENKPQLLGNTRKAVTPPLSDTPVTDNLPDIDLLSGVSVSAEYPPLQPDLNILDSGMTPNPTAAGSLATGGIRNVRTNNPGNIKDFGINWEGKVGSESGGNVASGNFVQFKNPEYGVRALAKDITSKRNRGLNTISKILNVYAPPGKENNTTAYINAVASTMGVDANATLTDSDMHSLVKAVTSHEGGSESLNYYTDPILKEGMKLAGY